ncbi:RpoE-regulated lipoprotein [Enterobacterales bacterium CwR94]|nr:RpoE-regulated lipoprotein [Enterobacterales bacterium CwR94]
MKKMFPAALIAVALLSGCASSGSSESASQGGSLWNPLNWSWSGLNPVNWFGSSLEISDNGVGKLNGSTPMTEEAMKASLGSGYTLRQGMRSENGQIVKFWQALEDKNVQLVVSGDSTVSRIDVSDARIKTEQGVKLGDSFNQLYTKAYGNCQRATGADSDGIECKAVGSRHISYLYTGDWHGPEGLIPADDTLKKWTISKIIWRR